ncbi:MAG: hypothetical protein EA351_08890 [Gemmatimonadales bacterium]|nr:MAG: hypothetical protein EA351_08890 [Gemmatimonadales bacterium]
MSPGSTDPKPDNAGASIRKPDQPGERAHPGKPGQADQAGDPAELEATFHCDLCGAPMLNRHCKLQCLQCGYQRDCSDP